MDDWRPFLASGKCYVLWKKMYAISLYRYDVCIYSGSREQIEIFVRETSRFLTLYFSPQFLPSRRELSWSFLRLQQFWESGRVFCSWGWVSSCLLKSRWFRSWSWELLLTRHYSQCLVKNKGECSFVLFNYDSFVSFRAIGVIWGIWELTAELVCLLFWTLCLVT